MFFVFSGSLEWCRGKEPLILHCVSIEKEPKYIPQTENLILCSNSILSKYKLRQYIVLKNF